jgi:2-polyprenyl-3-methyl-5-hydroxy-6-metoxy-1,4-benzoquinol methylase
VCHCLAVTESPQRWNHNIHYHRLILSAVPPGCARALDVGCGDGMLARRLRSMVGRVTAIDVDEASIELARAGDPDGQVDFVLGDFLTRRFTPGSFDLVTSVAALHHMDPVAALETMAGLLRPGGRLAVVSCARSQLLVDLPWEAAGVVAHRAQLLTKTYWPHPAPTLWPPPHTYRDIHRIARNVLPGVRYRRHLLWRYSLMWTKPATLPATSRSAAF